MEIYGNTKLALMPLLPILSASENLDYAICLNSVRDGSAEKVFANLNVMR